MTEQPATAPVFELVPVDALAPYARNARTHTEAQVKQIAASIERFGFLAPVVAADDGTIIAGHGRVLAAQRLGLDQVPVIRASHLSEAERRAYALADNRIAENAGWDEDLLRVEIADLMAGPAPDLAELLGWEEVDLRKILGAGGNPAQEGEDDIPAVPEQPVTRRGDLWLLGDHRLLCGDATAEADVASLLAGANPHLMVTDPPYGVSYAAAWRDAALGKSGGDGRASGKVENDDRADWSDAWKLFSGEVAYVWHADKQAAIVHSDMTAEGFEVRSQIIWRKGSIVVSRGNYHYQHEPCFYMVRKGGKGHWNGGRSQSTVWDIEHRKSETGHSTEKPVEAMRKPMLNNSRKRDAVYEPFSGSGTSIVAAETIDRRCYAMEIHPAYCDVAVERWQKLTGGEARLDGDGRTFAELRQERAGAPVEGAEVSAGTT